MGRSHYSDVAYHSLRATRLASHGVDAFTYTRDINQGTVQAGTHPQMDPKGVRVREARDSEAHPTTVPIGVLLDVTGSMSRIPRIVQKALPRLMGLLSQRGYVEHPQVLFGAIGDAVCDRAPLQIGQFESGVEMDEDLDRMYLEGGGGGHGRETYELGLYFFARHTATDCWERRHRRGYLFTIGDEMPYERVSRRLVHEVIGDTLAEDLTVEEIVREVSERWMLFHLIPTGSHGRFQQAEERWRELLGGRVVEMPDPERICELIGSVVGFCEGTATSDGVQTALRDLGLDTEAIRVMVQTVEAVSRGIRIRPDEAA